MIAIFTHRQASEADRVIRELRRSGLEPLRINTGHAEATAAILMTSHDATVLMQCDDRVAEARDIHAAWLHQLPPEATPKQQGSVSGLAAQSSRHRLWQAAMLQVQERAWLTPPHRLAEASNKVVQYLRAREVGLAFPPTVAGNDRSAVRGSLGEHVLMKYLGDAAHLWNASETGNAAIAVEVDLRSVTDVALTAAPALFQTRLTSAREVRVVVVIRPGGLAPAVFAAQARKPPDVVDIRLVEGGMTSYTPCTLPPGVVEKLTALLSRLKVGFCSADLLVDDEGRYWFLDLNATGAWWWIDDLYGGRVAVAIAEALRCRSQSD